MAFVQIVPIKGEVTNLAGDPFAEGNPFEVLKIPLFTPCVQIVVSGLQADSTNKHLTHQRSFYVELSRARHEAHFFTDSKAQLLKTIEKYTGEKTSALEITNQFGISTHKEQHVSKDMEICL